MYQEQLIACLKALSDPKRLHLLQLIKEGKQCNCDFSDALQLQPNLISHHLRILKEAGLVTIEKDPFDSRWIYYTINTQIYDELKTFLTKILDTSHIQPRHPSCGPRLELSSLIQLTNSNK